MEILFSYIYKYVLNRFDFREVYFILIFSTKCSFFFLLFLTPLDLFFIFLHNFHKNVTYLIFLLYLKSTDKITIEVPENYNFIKMTVIIVLFTTLGKGKLFVVLNYCK